MGNTIRRKPIINSIPAAPEYKFLNITNFGGIQKSSNPFVTSSNTASDCLNVYVDEDNALSTRPRLHKVVNLINKIIEVDKTITRDKFSIIGVYELHNGYLLHGIQDNITFIFKIEAINDIIQKIVKIKDVDNIKNKCKVFEQNNRIYVLTGSDYMNIVNDTLVPIEGYIPTTKIGRWKPTVVNNPDGIASTSYSKEGSDYESFNILSNKYKETYFWDATWDISDVVENGDVVENNYVQHTLHTLTSNKDYIQTATRLLQFIEHASYSSETYNYYLAYNSLHDLKDNHNLLILTTTKSNSVISVTSLPIAINNFQAIQTVASSDGKTIVIAPVFSDGTVDNKIHIFTRTSITSSTFVDNSFDIPIDYFGSQSVFNIKLTNDGKIITFNDGLGALGKGYYILRKSDDSYVGPINVVNDYYKTIDVVISKADSSKIFVKLVGDGDWAYLGTNWGYIDVSQDSASDIIMLPEFWDTSKGEQIDDIQFIASPQSVVAEAVIKDEYGAYIYSRIIHIPNITKPTVYDILDTSYSEQPRWTRHILLFNENYTKVYWRDFDGDNGGIIDLKLKKVLSHVVFDAMLLNNPFVRENSVYGIVTSYDDNALSKSGLRQDSLVLSSTEPLLVITKHINENDLADVFVKSTLIQRFDNNTWFASGNTTFHTEYNDPTYIPTSSYNDLGEDYEEITGLSIVNDNILAAYKRNKIYIITPTVVSDTLTYSYTETKNVIGNDVKDAPILTILTEMPVIVSYAGIYALNQLENVQSSDRITTLINEHINPNWLKERKEDIDGCITLNRLYWTYFILPHKQIKNSLVKDTDYTKIYLLDNRTQSWFYWELPIYVVSAMVKNNKTHFVSDSGDLFTFETTDLLNKYNPDVTEYYDELKTPSIIPWYWTSQILALNTINYAKRLVDTTFIVTDTNESDEYALNYKFKAYRKNKNAETSELTLSNNIEFVESITKRTMIPRFNFIQFTLSNVEDDLNNNKLRLVGLGLKYVLLGGLY